MKPPPCSPNKQVIRSDRKKTFIIAMRLKTALGLQPWEVLLNFEWIVSWNFGLKGQRWQQTNGLFMCLRSRGLPPKPTIVRTLVGKQHIITLFPWCCETRGQWYQNLLMPCLFAWLVSLFLPETRRDKRKDTWNKQIAQIFRAPCGRPVFFILIN